MNRRVRGFMVLSLPWPDLPRLSRGGGLTTGDLPIVNARQATEASSLAM